MNRKRVLSIIVVVAIVVSSLGMLVTANAEVGKHSTEVPDGYIAINNKDDMLALMNYGIENANVEKNNNYILMSDIAFEATDFEEGGAFYNGGKAWAPLGIMASYPYSGTFDGNGYTISGLVVNNSFFNEEGNCGFIGVNSGTVKNLHIKNSTMKITVSGEPNLTYATAYGSGIVGVNLEAGVVSNCSCTNTDITATSMTVNAYAGGIVGYNSGTINNCFVTDSRIKAITTSDRTDRTDKAIAGGISGSNLNATMWNVMATSDVEISVETAITQEGNVARGTIIGINNVLGQLVGAYYPEGTEFVGTGSVTKAVGIPLTDEQYKRVDYFGSFDFTNVWKMGDKHPVLRVNGVAETVVPTVTAKVELPDATPSPTPITDCPNPIATASPTPTITATTYPTSIPTIIPLPVPSVEPTAKPVEVTVRFVKKVVTIKKGKKKVLKVKITGAKKAKFSILKKGKKVVKLLKKKAKKVTVKGKKKGKAVICAQVGNKKAACRVTVK